MDQCPAPAAERRPHIDFSRSYEPLLVIVAGWAAGLANPCFEGEAWQRTVRPALELNWNEHALEVGWVEPQGQMHCPWLRLDAAEGDLGMKAEVGACLLA